MDSREAFGEVVKMLPQIQSFLNMFTNWDATKTGTKQKRQQTLIPSAGGGGHAPPTAVLNGMSASCDTLLSIKGVYSTEEWAHVPELGLKYVHHELMLV